MKFNVGDKVVCVSGFRDVLIEGKTYEISEIHPHDNELLRVKDSDRYWADNRFVPAPVPATRNTTEGILQEAIQLTTGDRNAQYGPPDQDFARTAALWTALFAHKLKDGESFANYEVAQAMICLKLSRLQHQKKRDSVVDGAGYFGCMDVCYREGEGYDG